MTSVRQPIIYNPKNNQLSITLPKKQLPFLKDPPKYVHLKFEKSDFEW